MDRISSAWDSKGAAAAGEGAEAASFCSSIAFTARALRSEGEEEEEGGGSGIPHVELVEQDGQVQVKK